MKTAVREKSSKLKKSKVGPYWEIGKMSFIISRAFSMAYFPEPKWFGKAIPADWRN